MVDTAQIEWGRVGSARSVEHFSDVMDANAVLEDPEIMIADGGNDRKICGNRGHYQKIHH